MNSNSSFWGIFLGVSLWGISHERRQDTFCAEYGVRTAEELWSHRRSLRRQRGRSSYDLRGTVSRDGFCAADMARESLRYRGNAWGQRGQTLCDGIASQYSSLDVGRCQLSARLAHLGGYRCTAYSSRAQALQRHGLGRTRLEEHRLRVGRNHARSVFEPVRLGAVSQSQGCGQVAHAFGPAGRNPNIYPYQRRQDARSQRVRLHADRSWCVLCHRSRLSGFHTSLCLASSGRILRHARQSKYECSQNLFGTRRSIDRGHLRSNDIAQRVLYHATLPRELETHSIQGCRERQDAHISDQQLCLAPAGDRSTLQEPLASRIVLQMDQAAPENQEVPGQQRERRQDANLVRRVDLPADCHRQEGTSN